MLLIQLSSYVKQIPNAYITKYFAIKLEIYLQECFRKIA